MPSLFTNRQYNNIQNGLHPDCCDDEVCSACGASTAAGACAGKPADLAMRLWYAAIRHDHNADPERVLHISTTNDAKLLDEAARALVGFEMVKETV